MRKILRKMHRNIYIFPPLVDVQIWLHMTPQWNWFKVLPFLHLTENTMTKTMLNKTTGCWKSFKLNIVVILFKHVTRWRHWSCDTQARFQATSRPLVPRVPHYPLPEMCINCISSPLLVPLDPAPPCQISSCYLAKYLLKINKILNGSNVLQVI